MTERIDMNEKTKVMAEQLPKVMDALSGLHSEVIKDGALSARTKELMMVAVAVSLRCEYCLWSMFLKLYVWEQLVRRSLRLSVLP